MRMQIRRFTRLTNGFSKKFGNHWAALALYFAYYNFCRIYCTLNACLGNATVWPEAPLNTPGSAVGISASLPFQSALAMFWPGAGRGTNFPTFKHSPTDDHPKSTASPI